MCPAEAINVHANAEADTNKKEQLNLDLSSNLRYEHDSLPEWSKGVDSSSTSASCVGSNPTGVNFENFGISGWRSGWMEWEEGVG